MAGIYEMTKKQILDMLMLLSALESWSMSRSDRLPDYLCDGIANTTDALVKEILGEEK